MITNLNKAVFTTLLSLCAIHFCFEKALAQNQPHSAASAPKTFALVIGVSRYQKLPGGQQLQFAERDAAAFAELMKKNGAADSVRLLAGAEATLSNIKSAIGNWLARSASEQDTVIIFFSGHGFYEPEFKEAYLLGYDSDPRDAYATALSSGDIRQALAGRLRAGRVLIIADAVRRDLFDPETSPASAQSFIDSLKEATSARGGASVIVASGPGEFSREGQRWGGHGVFLKHAIDALAGSGDMNSDGAINSDEFYNYVSARVAEDTSNKQRPWRSDASKSDLIISKAAIRTIPPATPARLEATVKKPAQPPAVPATVEGPTKTGKEEAIAQATKPAELNPVRVEPSTETSRQSTAGPVNQPAQTRVGPGEPKADRPASASSAARETVAAKTEQAAPRRIPARPPAAVPPPDTLAVNPARRESAPATLPPAGDSTPPNLGAPPRPRREVPPSSEVNSPSGTERAPSLSATLPASAGEPGAVPLPMQIEAAIYARNLIEPKGSNAWDLYQRLASDPSSAGEVGRLKPMLGDALLNLGKSIVGGDVRADNISDKVDEFKRAGQVFARARQLQPASADLTALEKLSAAQALIALQFYDEAERALSQLQGTRLAAIENAFGLTYQGKLDNWRAERAFKRATEIDSGWAAPHYNLALLYRSQQNESALDEFEQAAKLDPANVTVIAALGDELFTRQQWQRAADSFRKAIALRPADDTLHTKLGHALFSQGLQDEANRAYQKAKELRAKSQ
jgi:tetratricopeptide (TPR) repeat protein/uncharacterized caspase-like protein